MWQSVTTWVSNIYALAHLYDVAHSSHFAHHVSWCTVNMACYFSNVIGMNRYVTVGGFLSILYMMIFETKNNTIRTIQV